MKAERRSHCFPGVSLIVAALCATGLSAPPPLVAQDGTETEIVFTEQKEEEEEARQQLRRLLATYDLDPWIFTQEVRIAAGVDPRSYPILTLNTDFLDDDEMQLSVFLHEQAHVFVYEAPARDDAIEDLRRMYPDPPTRDDGVYQHLLVAWVELDAMAELVGEKHAREVLEAKVLRLSGESPQSEVDRVYAWYNWRVLEDTAEIGAVAARHAIVINPEKGLVVEGRG